MSPAARAAAVPRAGNGRSGARRRQTAGRTSGPAGTWVPADIFRGCDGARYQTTIGAVQACWIRRRAITAVGSARECICTSPHDTE